MSPLTATNTSARRILDQRQRLGDAARRFERFMFRPNNPTDAPARTVAERLFDLRAEPRVIDDDRLDARAASRSICHTISGLPPTSSSGLGHVSVNGRMRSPRPAAKIIAFLRECHAARLERVADFVGAAFEIIEQARERTQRRDNARPPCAHSR